MQADDMACQGRGRMLDTCISELLQMDVALTMKNAVNKVCSRDAYEWSGQDQPLNVTIPIQMSQHVHAQYGGADSNMRTMMITHPAKNRNTPYSMEHNIVTKLQQDACSLGLPAV
jgi:hypothetical protein